jgi:hypothetical protein
MARQSEYDRVKLFYAPYTYAVRLLMHFGICLRHLLNPYRHAITLAVITILHTRYQWWGRKDFIQRRSREVEHVQADSLGAFATPRRLREIDRSRRSQISSSR